MKQTEPNGHISENERLILLLAPFFIRRSERESKKHKSKQATFERNEKRRYDNEWRDA
jgi:hypothetical protein